MTTSIIIVTWNGLEWLKRFLPSVVTSVPSGTEIIVADNASSDDTASWVGATYPEVKVITFEHNYGYCGGNNRAAEQATGELLLFLNNDVEVSPSWLAPLSDAFEADSGLGAAQPKIRSHDDRQRFEYAGAAGGMIDRFGYPFCFGRVFDTCEIDEGQYDTRGRSIFWASGAALAVRSSLFKAAGGFDEEFQFHMEEIDLCWKIKRMGYSIACIPESLVFHVGGGSLENGSPRKLAYNVRNNLMMLHKHLPKHRFCVVFAARLILDTIAALRELSRGKFQHFASILSAYARFIVQMGSSRKKHRELVEKGLAFHTDDMIRILLPWQYFIRKRVTAHQLLMAAPKGR